MLEWLKESFFIHSSTILSAYIQCGRPWVEAGMGLPTWNLQATGYRHLPNDYTDDGYIINWDKGSEREEHSSTEKHNKGTQINAIKSPWGFC